MPAIKRSTNRIPRFFAALYAIVLLACAPQPDTVVLFDFESDADLDRFSWKCRSRFEISQDFSHSGRSSLRFEFHPAKQVGFSTGDVPRDWSRYKSLDFWVYNPSKDIVPLGLQINRREPNGKFRQLIAMNLIIDPGQNNISIPLVHTSLHDEKREPKSAVEEQGEGFKSIKENLKQVDGIYIFMRRILSFTVLYFDSFELK